MIPQADTLADQLIAEIAGRLEDLAALAALRRVRRNRAARLLADLRETMTLADAYVVLSTQMAATRATAED